MKTADTCLNYPLNPRLIKLSIAARAKRRRRTTGVFFIMNDYSGVRSFIAAREASRSGIVWASRVKLG
jgi:hypothetical protein